MKYRSSHATHALNAVCPYFTMFPVEFPLARIMRARRAIEDPAVLDVFCGRGTTLFAARALGLRSYGIDSSPIAVAIAKAKLASTSLHSVTALLGALLDRDNDVELPRGQFWRYAFHRRTLRDVVRLRDGLQTARDCDTARMLTAICLGSMHGPLPKNLSNAAYFSNQMPRTYASKPAYSVKYWKSRKMVPPYIEVRSVIRRRAERIFSAELPARQAGSYVVYGDSRDSRVYRDFKNIDLVVTSPPYFGMRTYIPDQWLRNWFLGGPQHVDYGATGQIAASESEQFASELAEVWTNVAQAGSSRLKVVVRFGGIRSRKADPVDLLHESFQQSAARWKLASFRAVRAIKPGRRQADQMRASADALCEFDSTWVPV